ncbi:hypothetical protein D923_02696 [Enterococcus faecalis 06-MB-S-04]|nr:hypothetical protein D923_02696 [Enterococcus faecalis 06-MB-S-04]
MIFGEFRLISEGVAFVPAVYQFLSLEKKKNPLISAMIIEKKNTKELRPCAT